MKTNTLMPVIKAILNDEEFLCGGIFTKEKQYAKKYDLTMEEIGNIQTCLYYALHIKDECYNERINHLCDWEMENMNKEKFIEELENKITEAIEIEQND